MTLTPLIAQKKKEQQEDFEANMLDGDSVDDCGNAMLSAKEVLEFFNSRLSGVIFSILDELEREVVPEARTGKHVWEVGFPKCRLCDEPRIVIDRRRTNVVINEKTGGGSAEVTEKRYDTSDHPCPKNPSTDFNSCRSLVLAKLKKFRE